MSYLSLGLTFFVIIAGSTVLVFLASFVAHLAANSLQEAWAEREKEAARAATLRGRIANRLHRTTA